MLPATPNHRGILARGSTRFESVAAVPVGAENCVVAGQAAFRYSLMSPPQRACGCPKMRSCALTVHDALHLGSLWVAETRSWRAEQVRRCRSWVPCVSFCTGCSCRSHAWLCARDAPRTLRSLCSATRASNLPVESPVGVLAATDGPYSVWRGSSSARRGRRAAHLAGPYPSVGLRCGPAGDGRAGGGAHPGRPRLAALIYAITLVAMFGFSAAHHRLGLTHRAGAVGSGWDSSWWPSAGCTWPAT